MANILQDLYEGATGKVHYSPKYYTATTDPNAGRLEALASQYLAAPSAAQAAAGAQAARANAAAMSQAASARGANSALMLREAQAGAGQVGRQIASDAAAAATAEHAGRFGGAASMYGKAGDLGMEAQGLTAQSYNMYNQLQLEKAKAEAEGKRGLAGGALAAAGGIMAMSDVRGKEDIRPTGVYSSFNSNTGETSFGKHQAPEYQPLTEEQKKPGAGGILQQLGGSVMSDRASKEEIDRLRAENDMMRGTLREQGEMAQGITPGTSLATILEAYRAQEAAKPKYRAEIGQATVEQPRYQAEIGEAQIEQPRFEVETGPAEIEDTRVAAVPSDRRAKTEQRMYSDERGKSGLQELLRMATSPQSNRENLGELDGYSYRYKPEMAEAIGEDTGRRVGVMAQDMERAPAGEQVVEETTNGKALDVNRALGFSLAGLAGLDERLRLLEEATGKRRAA